MIKKEQFYKIRRKSDGLYSTGGMFPKWEKTGKIWKNIGHLKNHMNQDGLDDSGDKYRILSVAASFYTPTEDYEIEVVYRIIDEYSGDPLTIEDVLGHEPKIREWSWN